MNTAPATSDVWFVRPAKPVSFELPPPAPPTDTSGVVLDLDYSDSERTLKRGAISADDTEEVAANDVLAEFPLDPTERFELRVPHAILARAALFKAMFPREHAGARRDSGRRTVWVAAMLAGACTSVMIAAALVHAPARGTGPSARGQHSQHTNQHTKGVHVGRLVAHRASELESDVPTVSFDSLPRAPR